MTIKKAESDNRQQVVWIKYIKTNMQDVKNLVRGFSIPSLACTDLNEKDEIYLMTANPWNSANEEYPEYGDIYGVDTETQEIWLFTEGEFNARFKEI